MNILKKLVPVLDWLPFIALALSVALLSVASNKIDSLKLQVKSQAQALDLAGTMLANQKTALDRKDDVIRLQSASVEALETAAKSNRAAYEAAQNTAAISAGKQQEMAGELLELVGPEGELEQCRAARELLAKELVG